MCRTHHMTLCNPTAGVRSYHLINDQTQNPPSLGHTVKFKKTKPKPKSKDKQIKSKAVVSRLLSAEQMSSMELQNTVKEALNALYHHPDDSVRMQADRWLQDFQRTIDAWQVLFTFHYPFLPSPRSLLPFQDRSIDCF